MQLQAHTQAYYDRRVNYAQLVKFFGTQQKAADAIGVTQASVCRWNTETHGRIPPLQQFIIERITGGALKVDADVLKGKRSRDGDMLPV